MLLSLEDKVESVAEPVARELSCEVVDVEYVSEHGEQVLRIYIDKVDIDGGVTVDDCAKISRQLGTILDVEEVVPGNYNLEVSSPGINRPVKKEKDFLRFKGEKVVLSTNQPINGRKNFKAVIAGVSEGRVVLEDSEGVSWIVELANIKKARLDMEI